ncbi:MAG TPA: hypothetical protein DD490_25870 [Acidobacteria bacterium]|nr:hypothetical protein [Acidobacteriota bacterium]
MLHRSLSSLSCLLSLACLACAGTTAVTPVAPQEAAAAAGPAGLGPTLGVRVGDLSPRRRARLGLPEGSQGALVLEVLYHGPAQKAGVMAMDLIEAIDGSPLAGSRAFQQEVARRAAGTPVTLSVRRGGGTRQAAVVLADAGELLGGFCEQGDGIACHLLGGLVGDVPRALELYRRSCDTGYAEGCSALGGALLEGRGIAADPERASALFEQACQNGSGSACAAGARQAMDEARAFDFAARACDQGDAEGCFDLATRMTEGRGAAPDPARALATFLEGCALGSSRACRKACEMGDPVACAAP